MTTTPPARTRVWAVFVLLLAAVLAWIGTAGNASAAGGSTNQNRVKALNAAVATGVGPTGDIGAGQRRGEPAPQLRLAQGRGVHTYYVIAGQTPVLVHNAGPCGPFVGGGASFDNIAGSDAARIQNAADRIGMPISLVGSRASGTAGAYSDWDYVITGASSKVRHSVSSSLPRGPEELGYGRRIDVLRGPLDESKPHITFYPRGGG